jgi:two-component system, LytTR family, response regulator
MNNPETKSSIKVVIVDDEQHAVTSLGAMIAKDSRIEVVATATDAKEAVQIILDASPDLVFLDIQMPGMNGFDVIKALKDAGATPYVIFVTAYDHFAIEAIKHSVFDYILKPVDKKELQKSVDRFLVSFDEKQTAPCYEKLLEAVNPYRKVRFSVMGGIILMPLNDILYAQADWNYAIVYRAKDDAEPVTMNLGAIEKILPTTQFVRINRSVIVNLNYLYRIKRADRQCVLKKDGVEYTFNIPVARIKYLEKIV